jgi:hypothetical protein
VIKIVCDNCGKDTGFSTPRGWGEAHKIEHGEQKFPCCVRFIVEPPIPDDNGEGGAHLCTPCMQEVLLKACTNKLAAPK